MPLVIMEKLLFIFLFTLSGLCWPAQAQGPASLRLVSTRETTPRTNNAGRLEILLNGVWGTVCDDDFDSVDAMVACRQLGFDNYVFYGSVGYHDYAQASNRVPIWLDQLQCTNDDTAIERCPHGGVGRHDCSHREDIALSCVGRGSLRLNNNLNYGTTRGRLEIYLRGQWGTVCDDSFDIIDANVACRQLGYSGSNHYGNVRQLGYSPATYQVPIWLDEVACLSSDTTLGGCRHATEHDCTHLEDVALSCNSQTSSSPSPRSTTHPIHRSTTHPGSVTPTDTSSSRSSGTTAGIVIGVLLFLILIGLVIFVPCCVLFAVSKRRRDSMQHRNTTPQTVTPIVQPPSTTTVVTATLMSNTATTTAQGLRHPSQEPYPAPYSGPPPYNYPTETVSYPPSSDPVHYHQGPPPEQPSAPPPRLPPTGLVPYPTEDISYPDYHQGPPPQFTQQAIGAQHSAPPVDRPYLPPTGVAPYPL